MLSTPSSARTRVSRRIAADPTSTALLLAAPAAVELWPGARRVGESEGRVLVAAPAPGDEDAPAPVVSVRALPPRRTPTAYVTRFAWSADDLPPVTGRLTLAYAPTGQGSPVTHAVLELEVVEAALSAAEGELPRLYAGRGLTAMAEGFLENLARAAETRNRAA